jgi:hypothetical protein
VPSPLRSGVRSPRRGYRRRPGAKSLTRWAHRGRTWSRCTPGFRGSAGPRRLGRDVLPACNLEDARHLCRSQRLAVGDVGAGHSETRPHRQAPERIVHGCPPQRWSVVPGNQRPDAPGGRALLDVIGYWLSEADRLHAISSPAAGRRMSPWAGRRKRQCYAAARMTIGVASWCHRSPLIGAVTLRLSGTPTLSDTIAGLDVCLSPGSSK